MKRLSPQEVPAMLERIRNQIATTPVEVRLFQSGYKKVDEWEEVNGSVKQSVRIWRRRGKEVCIKDNIC